MTLIVNLEWIVRKRRNLLTELMPRIEGSDDQISPNFSLQ